jgi:nucleoside-diphosphate-sugar epimerase
MVPAPARPFGPVFVTGATGFIGRAFLKAAQTHGLPVVALARQAAPADSTSAIRWITAPMDQVPTDVLAGCQSLVHLAAAGVSSGGDDWATCQQVNVQQSMQLWRAAVAAGIRRFVICGSCFEYGRAGERYDRIPVTAPLEPVTPYAASKAAATMLALGLAAQAHLELAVLRPFHVYGEGEAATRFWPAMHAAARAGLDFPMTAGQQVRDFTPVSLVAERFYAELGNSNLIPGQPVIRNVGTGVPQTLENFARSCWTKAQARGRLLVGALPMRANEVSRYVPLID